MNVFRAEQVADDWAAVRAELERAFVFARAAAQRGESFVFVVHHDDLLGRRGAGNAMVETRHLSSVRTAALEGAHQGWSANLVAYDDDSNTDQIESWAHRLATDPEGVTGELLRLGSSHLGKALP